MTLHARAAFEYTIDDLVDVAVRNANLAANVRSQLWRKAILLGALIGVTTATVTRLVQPHEKWLSFGFGALAFAVFVTVIVGRHPAHQRATLRRTLRGRRGPEPCPCSVELHDDHIVWREQRQGGEPVDVLMPWSEVRDLRPDGLDWLVESPTAVLMLRGRVFASPAEADAFFATAARLRAAASAKAAAPGVRA